MTALNEMLTFNRGVIFPHYPTRWAWNNFALLNKKRIIAVVAIPHGGLGTYVKIEKGATSMKSPSHTVGLELCINRGMF